MNEGASAQPAERDADATPGALLKRERERASLTVQQAAEDLHLDPWIIEAIESNRFLALGAPVYARGHLRKYATRLGVSADDILARYESLQDRPHEADPIPMAMVAPIRPPRRSLKGPALAVLAILVLGVLGYLAVDVFLRSPEPPRETNTSATTPATEAEPMASAPAEPSPTIQSPSTQTTEAPSEQETQLPRSETAAPRAAPEQVAAADSEASAPASPASVASADAPTIRVRLEFTDESWTEVYDANGARLFFGMGTPQRVRTLTGTPPIQVTLGAASAVNLQVNGESTVIPRREGREFARFTIDADGNLR